jgi:hypothetical protein
MTEVNITGIYDTKARKWNGHIHLVYVIGTDENGPVKIGQTSDIVQRIRSLQSGNPMPLIAFAVRVAMPAIIPAGKSIDALGLAKQAATQVERQVLADMREIGLRMIGEWVDLTVAEALEVVDRSASRARCAALSAEWLATHDARIHSEFGVLNDFLMREALRARAQADKINQIGLTFLGQDGNLR